jgi:outer membrane immunogenic protein
MVSFFSMRFRNVLTSVLLPALSLVTLTAPTRAQTQTVPASLPWTGFYVGADLGANLLAPGSSRGTMAHTGRNNLGGATAVAGPTTTWFTNDHAPGNLLGGLSIGYDQRITAQIVAGLVADLNFAQISNTGSAGSVVPVGVNATVAHTVTVAVTQKTDWFATLRGRVGITPFTPNLLLYGTGGLAFGRTDNSVSVRDTYAIPAVIVGNTSERRNKAGWTAGAGAEYAFASKWAIKAEWLYVDLGRSTVNGVNNVELVGPVPFPIFTTSQAVRNDFHVIRVGVNYRLGG